MALITPKSALLVASLSTAVVTSNVITVPVVKKIVPAASKDFVEREDQRRLSFASGTGSAPVTNVDVSYTTNTTVGGQAFNLIVDTGSSNTWVGAGATTFDGGDGSVSTSKDFKITYGSGKVSGSEWKADVSLGGLTASEMDVGNATSSEGFSGVDGIIGFGPTDLTQDTVGNSDDTIATFLDVLYTKGAISEEILGVSFAPITDGSLSSQNGILTLGGTDSSKYNGAITYTPITTKSPYSLYWGIDVGKIDYDGTTIGTTSSAIVDTGTTLIYIPADPFKAFLSATGGSVDSDSGLVKFSEEPTGSFSLTIGGTSYPLTPEEYLIPKDQYSNFGLSDSSYYAWIGDGGSGDPNFIIGQKFLERYYSVYDTKNGRVGFATSAA